FFGHDEGDLIIHYLAECEKEIAKVGFLVLFVDAREMHGTTAQARERSEVWIKAHKSQFRAGHILVRSKLLEMAVALVNLLTGGVLRMYSNVGAFERAIAREVPGFTRLPSFEGTATARAAPPR